MHPRTGPTPTHTSDRRAFKTNGKTLLEVSNEIVELVDEAYVRRGAQNPTDPWAFDVPMGKAIGTTGETSIRIVIEPGTKNLKTAYPLP